MIFFGYEIDFLKITEMYWQWYRLYAPITLAVGILLGILIISTWKQAGRYKGIIILCGSAFLIGASLLRMFT